MKTVEINVKRICLNVSIDRPKGWENRNFNLAVFDENDSKTAFVSWLTSWEHILDILVTAKSRPSCDSHQLVTLL